MNKISVLDCTLRDGGYINNFNFGYDIIVDIINKLASSNVDIIECGFLKTNEFDKDKTLFGSIESISNYILPKSTNSIYVAMIAIGDIKIEEISKHYDNSIDGIRLTFHKHQIDEAILFAEQLKEKGYKVFFQPVGTTTYSYEELLVLLDRVNKLNPYAFYMVDTLGIMFRKDLSDMFKLVDSKLNGNILVGFHSHNNLQLSFSNAIELLTIDTKRQLVIDSSVFGMGRGAGNLCTELIMKYINNSIENKYDIIPILEIFDEYINRILLEYKWGYALPYYLASVNNCHPNYATHLINKQTISIKQISFLLSSIESQKRELYDKEYIENLYVNFQKHSINDSSDINKIKTKIMNRKILILAPGKTVLTSQNVISKFCEKNNPIIFSVNFIPNNMYVDFLFVSNRKRIKTLSRIINEQAIKNLIATSNLLEDVPQGAYVINYSDYLNDDYIISDNAGLMLMNFLRSIGVEEINLVGFDGFSMNSKDNYYDSKYMNSTEYENLNAKTYAISKKIMSLSSSIKINFLTNSRYEEVI